MNSEEETWTAYHEAGHAVVGYFLGGQIESVGLWAEENDQLPERFGDCRINWGFISNIELEPHSYREILTLLAGPAAESVFRGESLSPSHYEPWMMDWELALQRSQRLFKHHELAIEKLNSTFQHLVRMVRSDSLWPAIAAVADELLAHEYLDGDQLSDCLTFWLDR